MEMTPHPFLSWLIFTTPRLQKTGQSPAVGSANGEESSEHNMGLSHTAKQRWSQVSTCTVFCKPAPNQKELPSYRAVQPRCPSPRCQVYISVTRIQSTWTKHCPFTGTWPPRAQAKFTEEEFILPWYGRISQLGDWWPLIFLTVGSICKLEWQSLHRQKNISLAQTLRQQAGSKCTKLPQPTRRPHTEKPPSAELQMRSKNQAVPPARHSQDRDDTEAACSHWRC